MSKLEDTVGRIGPLDQAAMASAQARQDTLTKPLGSLGRLEELSIQMAGITGQPQPHIQHKAIITMAGDHGVVAEGVSAYPQEVTPQMVYNFLRGGAGINVLARHAGARVVIVDMGVACRIEPHADLIDLKIALGTRNMAVGPAMSRDEARRAVEAGIDVLEAEVGKGLDIVGTGDMGIGNTTPSSAITAAFTGCSVELLTGRGTGINDAQLLHKVGVIRRALEVNQPDPADSLGVLAGVGGFEIGGLAGVILGAAALRIPVVIDGFISGAAALVACGLSPQTRDYLIPAHRSVEAGHRIVLEHLRLKPLLDMNLRLGEGTGAALAIFIAEAAARVLSEMATFGEAGVSEAT